jgi:DNA-binding transcriptional LysR family regulator
VDSELLRTFAVVVRTGSFTAAAQELGYVQSTVTGHVQRLERHLGARLVDRLSSGAALTETGSRLLPYAQQLLDLEARLVDEAAGGPGGPAGRVRLLAPESLCAYRLPTLIAELRAIAPGIHLSLAPAGTESALAAVREGATEAALVLEPELAVPDLLLSALGAEELALLRAPGAEPGRPTWAELAHEDVLLLEDGCSYSDEVARQLLAAGQPASRRVRFGSIEAVKRCAAAGLGWTVLPTVTAADELASGHLQALAAPLPTTPTVFLATHPQRAPSTSTSLVLEHLRTLWTHPG